MRSSVRMAWNIRATISMVAFSPEVVALRLRSAERSRTCPTSWPMAAGLTSMCSVVRPWASICWYCVWATTRCSSKAWVSAADAGAWGMPAPTPGTRPCTPTPGCMSRRRNWPTTSWARWRARERVVRPTGMAGIAGIWPWGGAAVSGG